MFRVELFVDDKKLAAALYALAGIAIGTPHVQPVANGKVEEGKAVAIGEVPDLFAKFVKAKKLTQVGPAELREFCLSMGRPVSSYSWYTKKLVTAGAIRKGKIANGKVFYNVTGAK